MPAHFGRLNRYKGLYGVSRFRDIIIRAADAPKHIVLAEGFDPRIIDGAVKAVKDEIATITLLGRENVLRALTRSAGDTKDQIQIIDPQTATQTDRYGRAYYELRRHKNISSAAAQDAVRNPLNFANMMVWNGDADGSVAGAAHPTPEVVRSALQIIGVDKTYSLVSSLFLMIMPDRSSNPSGPYVFTDCGLVSDPTDAQLADIASAASDNARALLGLEPKVAMLSFATGDSASHPKVDAVKSATALLRRKRPDLPVDGPMQFDAAIVPDVTKRKAPDAQTAGQANILVFPDLNSGNIGYKIAERWGGAQAIGPILQGLNKPATAHRMTFTP